MHVGSNLLQTVVFLGYADSSSPSGFKCEGSGFLLEHEGQGYLVTARHVAKTLGRDPFHVRVNRHGSALLLHSDNTDWTFHHDVLVDVAVTPAVLTPAEGYAHQYLGASDMLMLDRFNDEGVGLGAPSYIVGLFHFIHGIRTNTPMLHVGHLSLVPPPGEKIPVWNAETKKTELVEAYLVESRAIKGASGSPVFIRGSITSGSYQLDQGMKVKVLWPEAKLFLLGLFQAAWFLPPDDPLRMAVQAKQGDVVPVGLGVVVPAYKILEVLNLKKLKDARAKTVAPQGATPAGIAVAQPLDASDTNPTHREDFTSLLGAAARTRPQDG